jgi:hypothetical protein
LTDANWEKRQLKNGQWIERGQLVVGLAKYARSIGVGVQSLRTNLVAFEKCEMLTRQPTRQGTLLSICNYSTYQDEKCTANTPTNKQLTHSQHTANTQPTHSQHENKNSNKTRTSKEELRKPPPPPSEEVQEEAEVCWGNLKTAAMDAGMSDLSCIDEARRSGADHLVIHQLIEYARSRHDIGPGAIFFRIKNAKFDSDPTSGWPAAKTEHRRIPEFNTWCLRVQRDREALGKPIPTPEQMAKVFQEKYQVSPNGSAK